MTTDPARDNAHNAGDPQVAGSILTSLICDADGLQHDRQNAANSKLPGVLRDHFEVTPSGQLVSAHRAAL